MSSRQYKWAQKMKEAGKCTVCGKQAVTKLHCVRHAKKANEYSKKYQARKKDKI